MFLEKINKLMRNILYVIHTSSLSLIILVFIILQFFRSESLSFRHIFKNYQQKFRSIKPVMLTYPINQRLISPKTQMLFTEAKHFEIPICMKVWQKQRVKEDAATQIMYLLEGFIYNQRNAPGVYLGIAYLDRLGKDMDAQTFRRGFLTVLPHKSKLENGEYAILMRELNRDWRLDFRLYSEEEPLATRAGMEFLAGEIARLHKKAKISTSKSRGLPEFIAKKLEFNKKWFEKTLEKLTQSGLDVSAYQQIIYILESTVAYLPKFGPN